MSGIDRSNDLALAAAELSQSQINNAANILQGIPILPAAAYGPSLPNTTFLHTSAGIPVSSSLNLLHPAHANVFVSAPAPQTTSQFQHFQRGFALHGLQQQAFPVPTFEPSLLPRPQLHYQPTYNQQLPFQYSSTPYSLANALYGNPASAGIFNYSHPLLYVPQQQIPSHTDSFSRGVQPLTSLITPDPVANLSSHSLGEIIANAVTSSDVRIPENERQNSPPVKDNSRKRRATLELKRKPKSQHIESSEKKSSEATDEETQCCICLENPSSSELAVINNCAHKFCFSCIEKWAEQENTCPLCKCRFNKIERVNKKRKRNERSKMSKKVRKRDQANDVGLSLSSFPLLGIAPSNNASSNIHSINLASALDQLPGIPAGVLDQRNSSLAFAPLLEELLAYEHDDDED